jgi:predicted XRE-type DNA-binding protein
MVPLSVVVPHEIDVPGVARKAPSGERKMHVAKLALGDHAGIPYTSGVRQWSAPVVTSATMIGNIQSVKPLNRHFDLFHSTPKTGLAPLVGANYYRRMSIRDELLAEIALFLAETGMSPTELGERAMNDRARVSRLRAGDDIRASSVDKLRAFMRAWRASSAPSKASSGTRGGRTEAAA